MIGVGIEEEEMKDMKPSPLRCAVEHSENPELAEGVKQSKHSLYKQDAIMSMYIRQI